ncbi:hypothetical protein EP7_003441 [Isosphaeraceae bacterium EP7]
MLRPRHAVIAAILACYLSGCGGTDQPNPPAEVTDTFLKSSTDAMKNANSGMVPKKKSSSR